MTSLTAAKAPSAVVASVTTSHHRKSVVCLADASNGKVGPISNRRAALASMGLAAIPTFEIFRPQVSWGLLPDDDDAELVQKAKAARQQKLKEELATERQYAKDSGYDKSKDQTLIPVQRAVFELAKSGSQLESGNLGELANTVGGSWLGEFKEASTKISAGNKKAEESIADVYVGIGALASAAKKGDASSSKKAYVATVAAFQSWASIAGVASSLKGL